MSTSRNVFIISTVDEYEDLEKELGKLIATHWEAIHENTALRTNVFKNVQQFKKLKFLLFSNKMIPSEVH